jgi:hypothetical protein
MYHPKQLYTSGIITGSIMGLFCSFLSFMMVSSLMGNILTTGRGRTFLNLLIASNVFIGGFVGIIVAIVVHSFSKNQNR